MVIIAVVGALYLLHRAAGSQRRAAPGRRRGSRPRRRPSRRPDLSTDGASPSAAPRTLVRVIVAHLDLDAFYAAVEELENPELRAQPLVVGGDPRGRGVVATANYVARRFGIHSAMSAAEALRRCPQAVFVRPRHALYREYSRSVWETVRGVVPTVEQTGMDEGYLDVGRGRARLPRGARRRRSGADGGAGCDEPHVLARRRAVQGRREGRERRAQAGRSRRRPVRDGKRRSSRRSPCAGCRASGRRRRSGCAPPASRRSGISRR